MDYDPVEFINLGDTYTGVVKEFHPTSERSNPSEYILLKRGLKTRRMELKDENRRIKNHFGRNNNDRKVVGKLVTLELVDRSKEDNIFQVTITDHVGGLPRLSRTHKMILEIIAIVVGLASAAQLWEWLTEHWF